MNRVPVAGVVSMVLLALFVQEATSGHTDKWVIVGIVISAVTLSVVIFFQGILPLFFHERRVNQLKNPILFYYGDSSDPQAVQQLVMSPRIQLINTTIEMKSKLIIDSLHVSLAGDGEIELIDLFDWSVLDGKPKYATIQYQKDGSIYWHHLSGFGSDRRKGSSIKIGVKVKAEKPFNGCLSIRVAHKEVGATTPECTLPLEVIAPDGK